MENSDIKNGIHPLLAVASVVVIVAGLRAAASIFSQVLLAMLLVTCIAPIILWQLRRGWTMKRTIMLTVLGVVIAGILTVSLVGFSVATLSHKLPAYKSRLMEVGESVDNLLTAKGLSLAGAKTMNILNGERLFGFAATTLRAIVSLFSEAVLVLLLVVFIMIEFADLRIKYDRGLVPADSWAAKFISSGADVRKYVSITGWTGLLGACANFILLLILGVDAAGLWAFLSFLFNFIPNFGFILSVIPPALLALLEFGAGRAMIVVVGFVLINALVENVLKPRFIGKELDLSVLEIFLSLLFWSWVLGAIGAILAVPLTIMVKKLVPMRTVSTSVPAA